MTRRAHVPPVAAVAAASAAFAAFAAAPSPAGAAHPAEYRGFITRTAVEGLPGERGRVHGTVLVPRAWSVRRDGGVLRATARLRSCRYAVSFAGRLVLSDAPTPAALVEARLPARRPHDAGIRRGRAWRVLRRAGRRVEGVTALPSAAWDRTADGARVYQLLVATAEPRGDKCVPGRQRLVATAIADALAVATSSSINTTSR